MNLKKLGIVAALPLALALFACEKKSEAPADTSAPATGDTMSTPAPAPEAAPAEPAPAPAEPAPAPSEPAPAPAPAPGGAQ
jgi:type IV secretory pathway VirB10-like protein